jgi:glycosyltransferase involved in cell wall biosynthesis
MSPQILTSPHMSKATPKLSVLIPYYRDNPCALLIALDGLSVSANDIEIITYDDGTNDPGIDDDVARCLAKRRLPMKLIKARINQGRSAARNALQNAAKADWVLFLDADMRPVKPSFLSDYIALIKSDIADVIFGGFEVEDTAASSDRDLHRVLSASSDCLSLAERQAAGPQYVATSNLCVRKSVLTAQPFDSSFEGWGWEDSEWAARITKHYRLCHIDNPALHLGLETTDTLLKRFKTSGANYVRFTRKHPDLAENLALYRIATKLGRVPAQAVMRPLLRLIVKTRLLPMKVRIAALKLWRASWYADALRSASPMIEAAA